MPVHFLRCADKQATAIEREVLGPGYGFTKPGNPAVNAKSAGLNPTFYFTTGAMTRGSE
jgi:hypothetical protein